MASGSAQGLCRELRQAGNRATVAITSCVAVKSEASIKQKKRLSQKAVSFSLSGLGATQTLLRIKAQRRLESANQLKARIQMP